MRIEIVCETNLIDGDSLVREVYRHGESSGRATGDRAANSRLVGLDLAAVVVQVRRLDCVLEEFPDGEFYRAERKIADHRTRELTKQPPVDAIRVNELVEQCECAQVAVDAGLLTGYVHWYTNYA